jgi:nucleotide-binding universal stress UspA family protein
MATLLRSKLLLLHVLTPETFAAGRLAAGDVLESSYLHNKAVDIQQQHGFLPSWDVLHGEPGDALCRYLQDMPDAILAMTSHGRSGLRRAFLGSVAAECLRNTGLPMLIDWPPEALSAAAADLLSTYATRRRETLLVP